MSGLSSDVAFTPAVKAIQAKRGSREQYAKMEARGGWRTTVTADLAQFLAEARSFYLATANAEGQPYIQHRGGPPGFLRVIDERTLGFADFKGNRQYITTGNLAENPKAYIFVMDYAHRRRVKLWGRARVVEDDPAAAGAALAGRLQGTRRAGDPVRDRGLGYQLPAAHPADVPRRGRRAHAHPVAGTHPRAGGRSGRPQGRCRWLR